MLGSAGLVAAAIPRQGQGILYLFHRRIMLYASVYRRVVSGAKWKTRANSSHRLSRWKIGGGAHAALTTPLQRVSRPAGRRPDSRPNGQLDIKCSDLIERVLTELQLYQRLITFARSHAPPNAEFPRGFFPPGIKSLVFSGDIKCFPFFPDTKREKISAFKFCVHVKNCAISLVSVTFFSSSPDQCTSRHFMNAFLRLPYQYGIRIVSAQISSRKKPIDPIFFVQIYHCGEKRREERGNRKKSGRLHSANTG